MGFYHLRHDLNGRSDCKSTVVFDWITDKGDKPWIIIDYNNIILSMKTTGGYLMLLEWRLKLFWESLAKCGAKICIIKDGTHFSLERTVLKLKEFKGKSTIPKTKFASLPESKLDRRLAYSQCEKVLNEIFMGSFTSDIEDDNDDTKYINHKADGEADPAIRKFARRKCKKGETVYIMSNDYSLIIGVSPSTSLYIVRLETLKFLEKSPTLTGEVFKISEVLRELAKWADEILEISGCNSPGGPITDEMLPYIAALLDGETAREYYDQPKPILHYLNSFLGIERIIKEMTNDEKKNLYDRGTLRIATILVRSAWNRELFHIEQWITTIRDHALEMFSNGVVGSLLGFDAKISDQLLANKARCLLYQAKKMIPGETKYHGKLLDTIESIKSLKTKQKVSMLHEGRWYIATVSTNSYAMFYFNEFIPRSPSKLKFKEVADAISKEITYRYKSSLDEISVRNIYSLGGIVKTALDNVHGDDSKLLLAPLLSLANLVRSEYVMLTTHSDHDDVHPIPSVSGTLSFTQFNSYIRKLLASTVPVECDKIDFVTRAVERIEDSTIPKYTIDDLTHDYVLKDIPLPLSGIIIDNARNDVTGLQYELYKSETLAECNDDARYEMSHNSSTKGTLLNLSHRAHFITHRENRNVQREGNLDERTRRELAASAMFDALGLSVSIDNHDSGNSKGERLRVPYINASFQRKVDDALEAISDCWLKLPCPHNEREHLIGEKPDMDTAKILFAVVYIYAVLKHNPHASNQKEKELDLMKRISEALLLSPLFCLGVLKATDLDQNASSATATATSVSDDTHARKERCPAHDLFNIQNAPEIDFYATNVVFSKSVNEYSWHLLFFMEHEKSGNLCSTIDTIIDSVLDLMRYDKRSSEWIQHCRWYNMCGVLYVLRYLDIENNEHNEDEMRSSKSDHADVENEDDNVNENSTENKNGNNSNRNNGNRNNDDRINGNRFIGLLVNDSNCEYLREYINGVGKASEAIVNALQDL